MFKILYIFMMGFCLLVGRFYFTRPEEVAEWHFDRFFDGFSQPKDSFIIRIKITGIFIMCCSFIWFLVLLKEIIPLLDKGKYAPKGSQGRACGVLRLDLRQ